MKKITFILLMAVCFSLFAGEKPRCTIDLKGSKAGYEMVFSANSLVFFGVDYSHVKLIGDHGNVSGSSMSLDFIRDTYFNSINEVVMNEQKKFNFEKATGGKKVSYDFTSVLAANKSADTKDMKAITATKPLDLNIVAEMVKGYSSSAAKGSVGMVLIADQMNKFEEAAYFYVTFFDTDSKKLFFTAYVKGKAGGFGYRNYWAGAIASVVKDMTKSDWEYWKKSAKE